MRISERLRLWWIGVSILGNFGGVTRFGRVEGGEQNNYV